MGQTLIDTLRKRQGAGAIMTRKSGSNTPFYCWFRDIGHAHPLLSKQAVMATEQMYRELYAGDEEKLTRMMIHLDTLALLYLRIYSEARQDNLKGVALYSMVYEYLNEQGDEAREVYNAFCRFFTQSITCYLFTCQEMALELPETLGDRVEEHSAMSLVLTSLPLDLRRAVLQHWQQHGVWPSTRDSSPFIRELDKYLDLIKEDQDRRLKACAMPGGN